MHKRHNRDVVLLTVRGVHGRLPGSQYQVVILSRFKSPEIRIFNVLRYPTPPSGDLFNPGFLRYQ